MVPLILCRSSKRNLLTQRYTRSHKLFTEARPWGISGSIHWSINKPAGVNRALAGDIRSSSQSYPPLCPRTSPRHILDWMLARMDARVVNNLKAV